MTDFLDPDELPPGAVDRLAYWLQDHNVAVCDEGDDETLVYDSLETMRDLATALLQHAPGIRVEP